MPITLQSISAWIQHLVLKCGFRFVRKYVLSNACHVVLRMTVRII